MLDSADRRVREGGVGSGAVGLRGLMLLRRKPENWDVVLNFLCLPKSTISAFGDVLEKEILYISFWEGKFFLEIAQNWTKFFTYANLDFPSFPSCLQTELFLGRDGWFGLVLYSAISSRALPVVFGKSRDLLYCVWRRGWIWKHECWIYSLYANLYYFGNQACCTE